MAAKLKLVAADVVGNVSAPTAQVAERSAAMKDRMGPEAESFNGSRLYLRPVAARVLASQVLASKGFAIVALPCISRDRRAM